MKYLEIKIDKDCKFLKDFAHDININGNQTPLAVYNLMVTKRDLSLYDVGIKPYKGWKIGNISTYFGLKGKTKKTIIPEFAELVENVRVLYPFVRPYKNDDFKSNNVMTTTLHHGNQ